MSPRAKEEAARVLDSGYPIIRTLVGLGDPTATKLTIQEVTTQGIGGFSGEYDPTRSLVQVSWVPGTRLGVGGGAAARGAAVALAGAVRLRRPYIEAEKAIGYSTVTGSAGRKGVCSGRQRTSFRYFSRKGSGCSE